MRGFPFAETAAPGKSIIADRSRASERKAQLPSAGSGVGPGMNGLRAGGRKGLRVGGRIVGATDVEVDPLNDVVFVVVNVNGSKLRVCVFDVGATSALAAVTYTPKAKAALAPSTIQRREKVDPVIASSPPIGSRILSFLPAGSSTKEVCSPLCRQSALLRKNNTLRLAAGSINYGFSICCS